MSSPVGGGVGAFGPAGMLAGGLAQRGAHEAGASLRDCSLCPVRSTTEPWTGPGWVLSPFVAAVLPVMFCAMLQGERRGRGLTCMASSVGVSVSQSRRSGFPRRFLIGDPGGANAGCVVGSTMVSVPLRLSGDEWRGLRPPLPSPVRPPLPRGPRAPRSATVSQETIVVMVGRMRVGVGRF